MKREWDPGTFRVIDSVKGYVGQVYVTGTAGVSTVEYYILHAAFLSPDGVRTSEVEKATTQYSNFNAFWNAMQAEVTASGASARYVKAVCTYSTMDP